MLNHTQHTAKFQRAAEAINEADALIITAGAGMGVNSGLPDFRGTEGFWQAYPALAKPRIQYQDIAGAIRVSISSASRLGLLWPSAEPLTIHPIAPLRLDAYSRHNNSEGGKTWSKN